jgi:phasin family protein
MARGAASHRSVPGQRRVLVVIVKPREESMETSNQSTGTDSTSTPWLDDIKKLTEKFQLPGVDVAALVDWQRKDMETLVEANRQAYEGVRALIERRNEILQETLTQFQAAVKDATSSEAIAKQAEAGKQGVEQVLANIRELAEMEAQSRNNAWKVVQDRMQENFANLQKLLQPK